LKKSLVLALVAVLVLSFASMAFAAFTDTTTHWANPYINKLVDAKVVTGTTATTFTPDAKVTRAEFAKLIVGAKGLALENPATATFSDVATSAWYFPYVEAAAKAKLIDGVGAGKFDPTALVTREQVAKMVVLAAGKTADATKAINFDDKASISDWAKGYVAVAADLKLITGYNNKFSPKANATRAEAAKLIYEEMLYEGKITAVTAEVPVGFMKVTDTPADNTAIELDGTEYTIDGTNFKIAGEYVSDAQVFIEGTLVKVTMNSDDEVLSMEANPKVVEGEVNGTGTIAGDRAITVNDKDIVWVDEADYDPTFTDSDVFTYGVLNPGDNVVVLLNSEGLGYAALAQDSVSTKGDLTSFGTTNKDEYYFVVDGKKYLSDEDTVGTSDVQFVIYKNDGTKATTAAALTTLMGDDVVAKVETDASGLATKVTAYAKEITGTLDATVWADTYRNDSKNYENFVKIAGIKIGQKGGAGTPPAIANEVFRALNGSAVVTLNGTAVDYEDIDTTLDAATTYSATAYVNGSGEVVKLVITDTVVYGQIKSFIETSSKVSKITIFGSDKEYTLATKYNQDTVPLTNKIKVGYVVKGSLNPDGELVLAEIRLPKAEGSSNIKFQQYSLVATSFKAGTDPDPAVDHTTTVTGGVYNIRIQNADSGAVTQVNAAKFILDGVKVKLNAVPIDVTIILVDDSNTGDNVYDYAVIKPITKTN